MQKPLVFELLGILFIIAAGSLLHFAYAWSGNAWWMGIFAAVNESVWEHLKLAYWPALIWSVFGWVVIGHSTPNFWIARAAALISMPLVIALGFYAYTALLGHHALVFDLVLFGLAIVIGQMAAVAIYRSQPLARRMAGLALLVVLTETVSFVGLTFFPLELPIFVDHSAQEDETGGQED